MVEAIKEEYIEALDVSINVVANGSNTIDVDVGNSGNEQHESPFGKQNPLCTHIECTDNLYKLRVYI